MDSKNAAAAKRIINAVLRKVKEDAYCLVYAVDILKPEPRKGKDRLSLGTDGEHLFFDPEEVLKTYRYNGTRPIEEEIFHILLHGILGHFGMTKEFGRAALAGYVMDLQIEQILEELGIKALSTGCLHKPSWYKTVGFSLYNTASRDKLLAEKVCATGALRRIDDHSLWWNGNEPEKNGGFGSPALNNMEGVALKWAKARKCLTGSGTPGEGDAGLITAKLKETSERFKDIGMKGGCDEQCFIPEGERKSFSELLLDFLKNRTVSREQPDFMDPMLYEYGLSMYGNVPLVEPLEEMETKTMDNIVIAIDTSGSCHEHIGRFFNQLIGIFEEAAEGFSFERIYVIQCDAEIQDTIVFDRMEELKLAEGQMRFKGFGGTDFRPVFDWIDRNIIGNGDHVGCLLYFSDAEGIFPAQRSEYPTVFVLPEDRYAENIQIPGWVDKVMLN